MKNNRGQALVEYVLIIALISVITISLVNYFGGYLKLFVTYRYSVNRQKDIDCSL